MARLAGLVVVATMVLGGSAAGQIAPRQASYPDSLVTLRAFHKACRLASGLFSELAKSAQENLDLATASASRTPSPVNEAERLRTEHERDSASAQLTAWETALPKERRDRLDAYCKASNLESLAQLQGIPGRTDIVKAAAVRFIYNPNNEQLAGGAGGFLSFLGIDQGALVSGLVQFLVDRAAAEVQLAFVDRVKARVCKPTLEMIFDATCLVLDRDHLALHSSVLRELHAAAEEDLSHLPRTGPLALIASTQFMLSLQTPGARFTRPRQDLVLSAYLIGSFVDQLIAGAGAPEALFRLANADSTLVNSDETTGLMADALVHDSLPVSAGLYRFALVGQMLPDEDSDGKVDWPSGNEAQVEFVKTIGVNLLAWIPELKLGSTMKVDSVIGIASGLVKALDASKQHFDTLRQRMHSTISAGTVTLAEYSTVVDDALAIADDWAQVFVKLGKTPSPIPRVIKDLRKVAKSLASQNYSGAALGFYALVKGTTKPGDTTFALPAGLEKTISFVTAIAQAGSSKEIAGVIDAYAAPVGSYRVKRGAERLYLVLNGYLGAGGGLERVDSTSGFAGVTAPIGIEFGGSLGKGWSLGILAQVLDLGTPASYRMTKTNEQLESEPEVGFAQVFSPGGYLVLGLKNLPVAFGAGINLAPSLRKTSNGSGETRNATRFALFLSIDMPLLHLR